jgi:hypothetical protein
MLGLLSMTGAARERVLSCRMALATEQRDKIARSQHLYQLIDITRPGSNRQ